MPAVYQVAGCWCASDLSSPCLSRQVWASGAPPTWGSSQAALALGCWCPSPGLRHAAEAEALRSLLAGAQTCQVPPPPCRTHKSPLSSLGRPSSGLSHGQAGRRAEQPMGPHLPSPLPSPEARVRPAGPWHRVRPPSASARAPGGRPTAGQPPAPPDCGLCFPPGPGASPPAALATPTVHPRWWPGRAGPHSWGRTGRGGRAGGRDSGQPQR